MAAAVPAPTAPAPNATLDINDPNFGRDEYISDCIQQILKGKEVLITLGGFFDARTFPPLLRKKYKDSNEVFFPGFLDALKEVTEKITKLGKEVIVTEFRGGSNSDALGLIGTYDLDGHFVSVKPEVKDNQPVCKK